MNTSSSLRPDQQKNVLHVFVTVSGGVAYAAEVPSGVAFHIIDFDDLKSDRNATLAYLSDIERAFVESLEVDS